MKYFTDNVSNDIVDALKQHNYPFGNTVYETTYAQVLDWLKENDIDINVTHYTNDLVGFSTINFVKCDSSHTIYNSFIEGLKQIILFALELIE